MMKSKRSQPFKDFGLTMNFIFLILSILAVFWFFEPTWEFLIILGIYLLASTLFTTLFYLVKARLQRKYLSESMEKSARPALLFFLFLIILNFAVLFLFPNLWLIIICGMVAGLSISEILIRYKHDTKRK